MPRKSEPKPWRQALTIGSPLHRSLHQPLHRTSTNRDKRCAILIKRASSPSTRTRRPQEHALRGGRTTVEFVLIADRAMGNSGGSRGRLPLPCAGDQRPIGRMDFASFAMPAMPRHRSGPGFRTPKFFGFRRLSDTQVFRAFRLSEGFQGAFRGFQTPKFFGLLGFQTPKFFGRSDTQVFREKGGLAAPRGRAFFVGYLTPKSDLILLSITVVADTI
jgi:hypothetical protein